MEEMRSKDLSSMFHSSIYIHSPFILVQAYIITFDYEHNIFCSPLTHCVEMDIINFKVSKNSFEGICASLHFDK